MICQYELTTEMALPLRVLHSVSGLFNLGTLLINDIQMTSKYSNHPADF